MLCYVIKKELQEKTHQFFVFLVFWFFGFLFFIFGICKIKNQIKSNQIKSNQIKSNQIEFIVYVGDYVDKKQEG